MTKVKIVFWAAIAAVVLALCALGAREAYNRGVQSERSEWDKAKALAAEEQLEQERETTRDSEQVADTHREQAREQAEEARRDTTQSIERIEYVYVQQPAPPCLDAGAPRRLPDSVLRELDAAVDAVSAAKGGLPAGVGAGPGEAAPDVR